MLDKDIKNILQEQFSQEGNYKKILDNVNRKLLLYNKILKFALVPTFTIIFVAIIILNTNNNKYVANNENNIITNNNTNVQVAKNKIYKTIKGEEACWAYDPTIPSNLINDCPESKYVVRAKILSVGEGEMLTKQENYYDPFTCYTPIKIQIIDNLLDTNKLSNIVTAYMTGGKIKIANILNGTKEEIEYMGIYDQSQVDPEQYIEYISEEPYYELSIGDEYVMIINKTTPSLYQVFCGGYGIFKIENSNEKEIYKNVITNKILEI